MKRKINNWSEYEKFKISQDIQKYFGDFVIDLKSKVKPDTSFSDVLALALILFTLYVFTKSICSKLYEKKNNN